MSVNRGPAEKDRDDVRRRREHFRIATHFVEPEQLVFLNESGARMNMTRLNGWAERGHRLLAAARTCDNLVTAIGRALRAVSLEECRNYFRSCGYAT